ncbi:iron chaperone [Staphylococcus massiliensis]|uniref:YdhG-like domain-containing protein n=1 Tax=Staphylococcus massiliensis S46 TaxID=1229783 RepID=K9B334_9STAP|nr:DUF1801 domain-containing protein [Staphylococcus massiliensis]EKU48195.1 hypothetical protein C273_05797 [Staphylococcus massiliensis S46]MCG3402054.1 DUF1801 domain-containing protein [Staphylococcus massiliensis]MCG3412695.1 DUF1801 domain-containing protein [Staphylococcus massiliensis]POA01008.1 hypothetical protein CD133_03145 [Staphylococcus massiliensis CCUG 55927]
MFSKIYDKFENKDHRETFMKVVEWVHETYPNLEKQVKWNQPMYANNGTFIIAFSFAKKHFSVAPETVTIHKFAPDLKKANYEFTDNIIKIKWDQEVDYTLLQNMIDFNIEDKANCTTFWRK